MTETSRLATISPADREAYETYLRVRDEVVRLKGANDVEAGEAEPSRYWAEELEQIDYLIDASPLVIRKLRHHAFQITGVRPYDYHGAGEQRTYFERRLRALVALAGGAERLVGDHDALGGFGFSIDGRRHNVDTLKFFEVLTGMSRAGLLETFRAADRRRMVLEIGAGWGGFAYQFRTLFPQTTYVVLDFPELFLFSATYLMTVFPHARMRFWREGEPTFDRWHDADFIFVPNQHADALRDARPDLLVNLVSFQEMTAKQVETYTELAAVMGCPAIYSLNRDRSAQNEEIDRVSAILSRHYELREIPLLGSGYLKATKKDSAISVEEARRTGRLDPEGYRHLAGSLKQDAARASVRGASDAAPLVGIGVTLRNRAEYLTDAIDSLLAQSYTHFELVLVDDGSTDGTEAIARAYEQRDPRVRYIRFTERRGMVAAWRSAFEQASAGGASYFAWGSDHDRWHPRWLETLVGTLEQYPDVLLAYPLTQRIDPSGAPLAKPARQFETFGVGDRGARWRLFNRSDSVAAGDMVYGLMRVAAVRDAGVFREVLCPDRLLLAELTLRGQIRQVPEVLWYRRQFAAGSIERQRSTLFGPGTRPPLTFTPPWYMHARSLWATYGREPHPAFSSRSNPKSQTPNPNQPRALPLISPQSPWLVSQYLSGALRAPRTAMRFLRNGYKIPARSRIAVQDLSRAEVMRLVIAYAAAYAWRHYAKSTVQRGLLSVLGWPRWMYKRAKRGALLGVYGVLVASRHVGLTPLVERLYERVTGRPGAVRMRTAQPVLAAASHSDAAIRESVKILFLARHFTYFRNYESVIATLAERGHQLHLAAEREEDLGGREMVERLAREHQGVSFGWIPAREDRWEIFATKLRMTIDYLRYLDPAYAGAPKLRARAKERVPRVGLWLLAAAGAKTTFGRRVTRAALNACERVIPRSPAIDEFLREQRPDVVLFTPLIGVVASPQLDYLQSAKALGYPTALCVWSWDHLSSKAILRSIPDRVLVWNETQREEAVTLHGVPPERVVVTGAQCFDQWFDRKPSTDRGTFCRKIGLPDGRAFLLYVCSALFQGSASEALFVQRWIRALRASRLEPLASTPIVVRPHPARLKEWADVDLTAERDVTLWGRNPVDPEARTDYFDSLHHSAAVVGLNTSAFLEGAIAGKPVFATLLPEHHENQEGTIHFHYLLHVGGGLLHTARTLGDHFEQLNAALQASEPQSQRSLRFVEAFIRPRGVGVAAAPVFADEVERLSANTSVPGIETTAVRVLRGALAPVAAFAALRAAEPLMLSAHEREIAARHRAHRERVAAAWRVKDAQNASEQQRKDARVAGRERYKAERAAEWRRSKSMK